MEIDEREDLIEAPLKKQVNKPQAFANHVERMVTDKGMVNGAKDSASKIALNMGGCRACPFIGTTSCPYFPEVTRERIHKDGYCGKFKMVIQAVTSGNYVGITKQKQYINLLKDQTVLDHLFVKWSDNPDKIPKELLAWSMHVQDTLVKIRKQEEGSKLSVKKELSPSQVLAAIREAEKKTIDAEYKEVFEEDGSD
jgi:hypothetical protein